MSNVKKYEIEHCTTYGSILVAVNHDFTVVIEPNKVAETWNIERVMKEILMFWTSGQGRIDDNEDNIQDAFLKLLCEEVMRMLAEQNNLNEFGIKSLFENREGWFKMDGSFGVEILGVDPPIFNNQDDYVITELTK